MTVSSSIQYALVSIATISSRCRLRSSERMPWELLRVWVAMVPGLPEPPVVLARDPSGQNPERYGQYSNDGARGGFATSIPSIAPHRAVRGGGRGRPGGARARHAPAGAARTRAHLRALARPARRRRVRRLLQARQPGVRADARLLE